MATVLRLVEYMSMGQWYEAWETVEKFFEDDSNIGGNAYARVLVIHVAREVIKWVGEDWENEIVNRVGKVLATWASPGEFLKVHDKSCYECHDFTDRYAVLTYLPMERFASDTERALFVKEAMGTFHDSLEAGEGPPSLEYDEEKHKQLADFYRFCLGIDRETTIERAYHFVACTPKDYRAQWRAYVDSVLAKRVRTD